MITADTLYISVPLAIHRAVLWGYADGWQRLENTQEQETSNMSLGIRLATCYEQGRLDLKPGNRILMFTDGLFDAEDANGEPFGEPGLLRVLAAQNAVALAELNQAVLMALAEHTGGVPLDDDITILAAEVR